MTSDQLTGLPPDAVLVHIGPHKTGTTAIQSMLADSRALLREAGVYYPGKYTAHHREAMALRQYREGWREGAEAPPDPAVWTRLAQRVGDVPGRVVISSEFFAQADEVARAQLVRDLGPDRVHILAAARNPAGIAVSTWQQVLRTYGRPVSLEEWLEKNFRDADALEQTLFWGHADPAALVAQWAGVVPADRLTLVVLDEGDRRLLPTTFEQLLALPEGLLADQRPSQPNRGLSAVEAALVRQIAVSLDSRLSWSEYARTMRGGVIRRLLEVREPGPDEAKAQLPAWALEQAVERAERSITGLQSSGVRIVGDLASLRGVSGAVREDVPIREVPIEIAAEAVVGAIAIATRDNWSLDAPPSGPKPAQRQKPTQRRKPAQRQAAVAQPSPRVDAVPTRELAVILAKRVRAGLRRRDRRVRLDGQQAD